MNIIRENPFLLPGRPIYCIPNTNHAIVISAGLKGNSGIGGNYVLSASYSIVNKMIFYSNIFYPPTSGMDQRGNYFTIQPDDAEVFNVHGELSGKFSKRMSFNSSVDYYKYTLSANQYAWNKPDWKGRMGLFYNLRDKIIAGAEVTALGSRKLLVGQLAMIPVGGGVTPDSRVIEQPVHVTWACRPSTGIQGSCRSGSRSTTFRGTGTMSGLSIHRRCSTSWPVSATVSEKSCFYILRGSVFKFFQLYP